ncbi:unnamed protein product [Orchesella dallaii]|uniref:Secreted protein n=1 Tax=Orchesella dallaii TaxID=48710 RepID=A0ABP1QTH9_9HEXA
MITFIPLLTYKMQCNIFLCFFSLSKTFIRSTLPIKCDYLCYNLSPICFDRRFTTPRRLSSTTKNELRHLKQILMMRPLACLCVKDEDHSILNTELMKTQVKSHKNFVV